MALDTKEFTIKVDTGLKSNKEATRFYYNYTQINGIRKRGLIDYSNKSWDKRERIRNAKAKLNDLKEKNINENIGFTENSTLDKVAEAYFNLACDDTEWNKARKIEYNKYVGDIRTTEEIQKYKDNHREFHNPTYKIGKKKIKDIKTVHIDAIKKGMEKAGLSKQNINGCSPRTIKKVLAQVIKPILQYAVDNDVLPKIPKINLPQQTAKKKEVTNGTHKLATLFKTINTLYSDNAFYRALFLFALYGRRWNEIRTLKWNDVDLSNNLYTIRAEVNKVKQEQTYTLPDTIRCALLEMKENHQGLVFKSPITGKELHSPRKQLNKIKETANIPELTMHLFRHILVTALGESEVASSVLSASLGHTNELTVGKHYQSINHTRASNTANKAIQGLING